MWLVPPIKQRTPSTSPVIEVNRYLGTRWRRTPTRVAAVLLTSALWGILTSPALALERSGNRLLHNGEEIWLAGIDFQSLAVHPGVDSKKVLDRLQQAGLNKVRIWAYPWFLRTQIAVPWSRDQDGKADLDTWNEAYWETVRLFVGAAQSRGIIVEYTLFASKPSQTKWWHEFNTVWNAEANINGVLATNSEGHAYPEFYNLNHAALSTTGKSIADYQRAFIDKSVKELASFDNLFFEISNEFPTDFQNRGFLKNSVAWALHWAEYVAERTERLVAVHAHDSSGSHLRGLSYYLDQSSIDILNFHFYSGATELAGLLSSIDAPENQVLQSNESHAFLDSPEKLNTTTQEAWAAFLSGMHYSFFFRDKDGPKIFERQWEDAILRLATIHKFADEFATSDLSIRDRTNRLITDYLEYGPAPHTQWLAATFKQSDYIFYFWSIDEPDYTSRAKAWLRGLFSDESSMSVNLPCTPIDYRWTDANRGKLIGSGTTTDCPVTVPVPATTDWNPESGLALTLTPLNGRALVRH